MEGSGSKSLWRRTIFEKEFPFVEALALLMFNPCSTRLTTHSQRITPSMALSRLQCRLTATYPRLGTFELLGDEVNTARIWAFRYKQTLDR
jgi:hypothetical protein